MSDVPEGFVRWIWPKMRPCPNSKCKCRRWKPRTYYQTIAYGFCVKCNASTRVKPIAMEVDQGGGSSVIINVLQ